MGRYNDNQASFDYYKFNGDLTPERKFDARNYVRNLEKRSNSEQALKITIKRGVTKPTETDHIFHE